MTTTELFILGATQIAQAALRAWNIKCLARDNVFLCHLSWQLYGAVWIVSMALGVEAVQTLNIAGIATFFVCSGIGMEIGRRLKNV